MAQEQEQPKQNRPPREGGGGGGGGGRGAPRADRPGGGPPHGDRPDRGDRGDRRGFDRGRPEGPPEIELEKLIGDSPYLDNQAHAARPKSSSKSSSGTACTWTTRRMPSSAACAIWIAAPRASCGVSTVPCGAPCGRRKASASTSSSCCAPVWLTPSRATGCAASIRSRSCCSR